MTAETMSVDSKRPEESSHRTVSIIISTHNRKEELFKAIYSILENTKGSYEIIVVSANSTDGTNEELPLRFPDVRLILAPDVGWGEANNIGAMAAKGDYFFFSGPDMVFEDNWLDYLLEKAKKIQNLGSIGTVLFREYENKGVFITGGSNFSFGYVIHKGLDLSKNDYIKYLKQDETVEVGAVLYPMIPRDVFFKVGGFDPYYFYICDEMDIGIRIKRAGYKNVVCFGKYMKTAMTPSSDKTFFYWNRNRIRLIVKFNNFLLLPFYLSYPLLRLFLEYIEFIIKGNHKRTKLLIDALNYNIVNFKLVYKQKSKKYVNE